VDTARRIFRAIGSSAVKVALTVDTDADVIVDMVTKVEPDLGISPDGVRRLRERVAGVRIMQAIPMGGDDALSLALAYQECADILLLDSQAPDIPGIGASGETHDWNKSAEIVKRVRVPVILAGGLSPDNVEEAIRKVRPWGVDSLTHTNLPLGNGSFRKDLEKVRRFAARAKREDL